MNEFEQQLVDEACYPCTRAHRWFARAQCLLFLTILFLVAYPRDTRMFLVLASLILLLAIGSEAMYWYVRKTCTKILVDGIWSHGVVTAKRFTRRWSNQYMTVAVEVDGQSYEREAIVGSKTYFRFQVGQTVQVLRDRQPGGRWVLLKDACGTQAEVDR